MKLYIVRHGVTQNNIEKIHQTYETPINEEGKKQAKIIAEKLKNIRINKIYASPLLRTRQTAEIIASTLNVSIENNELIAEIKKPSEISGKKHTDPKASQISKQLRDNYHNHSWHYSDEENFMDVKQRCISFLKSIDNHIDNDSILLVTHNYIAMFLTCLVIFGDKLTSQEFLDFYDHTIFSNVGVTEIEYIPTTGFKLISWNTTVLY